MPLYYRDVDVHYYIILSQPVPTDWLQVMGMAYKNMSASQLFLRRVWADLDFIMNDGSDRTACWPMIARLEWFGSQPDMGGAGYPCEPDLLLLVFKADAGYGWGQSGILGVGTLVGAQRACIEALQAWRWGLHQILCQCSSLPHPSLHLLTIHIQCAAIKKTPVNKYHYFRYKFNIFFTKFSEIILDTICHYCCKFYHLTFRYSEVAQLWI